MSSYEDDGNGQAPVIPGNDGWDDAATEGRQIRGKLLKFADWRFTAGKEGEEVSLGTKLIAKATVALWQRWEDGKPQENIIRRPGHRPPERDELSHQDKDEWELDPRGEPQDPWRNTRLIYLEDPRTAEVFTFSTSSWGGRSAVSDLGDQITRMRLVHPDAQPIVELRAAKMETNYGPKSRPAFKVVGWLTADNKPVLEREINPREAKRIVDQREMNDEVPF